MVFFCLHNFATHEWFLAKLYLLCNWVYAIVVTTQLRIDACKLSGIECGGLSHIDICVCVYVCVAGWFRFEKLNGWDHFHWESASCIIRTESVSHLWSGWTKKQITYKLTHDTFGIVVLLYRILSFESQWNGNVFYNISRICLKCHTFLFRVFS